MLMPETGNAESLGMSQFPGPAELQPEQRKMGKAESLNPVTGEDEIWRWTHKCCFCPSTVFPVRRRFITSVQGQILGLGSASVAPWQNGEAAGKEESCRCSMRVQGLQVFTLNRARSSLLTIAGGLLHDQENGL